MDLDAPQEGADIRGSRGNVDLDAPQEGADIRGLRGNVDLDALRGKCFCFEGIPGSGKTTLVRSINNYINSRGVNSESFVEPINESLLELYMSNMSKYSFAFQMYMLGRRIAIVESASRNGDTVSLIDRGIEGDKVFATIQHESGWMTKEEFDVYSHTSSNHRPHITIYLKCDHNKALNRLRSRANADSCYTKDYMSRLEDIHNRYFDGLVSIDFNKDEHLNDGMLDESVCISVIKRMINAATKVQDTRSQRGF